MRAANASIVFCQHALLLGALGVLGVTTYLLCIGVTAVELLPSFVLMLVSGALSLVYLLTHNIATILYRRGESERKERALRRLQWLAKVSLRVLVTLWVATCGVASSILFVLVHKTDEPFRCHLFGVLKKRPALPISAPYRPLDRSYVSDLSFKCRSSRSLSARTLATSTTNESRSELPSQPSDRTIGLGIYKPQPTQLPSPCFFSAASFKNPPTTSRHYSAPAPKASLLPAHLPPIHRRETAPSALHRAIHPPKPPPTRPVRPQSVENILITPPSPTLSTANLNLLNKTTPSRSSSLYSCSTSGEIQSPRPAAPALSNRTASSSSTARRSPLGVMRRAEAPDLIVQEDGKTTATAGLEADVDDVEALEAVLTASGAVPAKGWYVSKELGVVSFDGTGATVCGGGKGRKLEWTPLSVARTRASLAFPKGDGGRGMV
ncbi:hypothetical protein MBLNU230_g0441t1 [Neophaeotheca triangularis]